MGEDGQREDHEGLEGGETGALVRAVGGVGVHGGVDCGDSGFDLGWADGSR